MALHANFVSSLRQNVVALLNAVQACRDSDLHWTAEGYSGNILQGDLTGLNADLAPADVTAMIVSVEAILNLLAANGNGHYTNLMKARA